MNNNQDERLELLDMLLMESLRTEGINPDVEKNIDRIWLSICNDFYKEDISLPERITNLERYISEHRPWLSGRMKANLIRRQHCNAYLAAVMEDRLKQQD